MAFELGGFAEDESVIDGDFYAFNFCLATDYLGAFIEEDNDSYAMSMFGFITKKTNGRIYFNKAFGGDALINLEGDEASISAAGTKTNVYEMNVDRKNISCSVSDFSDVIAENRSGKDAHWAFVRICDDVVIDVVLYKTVNP